MHGKNRHGQEKHVDLNYLAEVIKGGTYDLNNFLTKNTLKLWLSDAEIANLIKYANTHSVAETVKYLGDPNTFPASAIFILDEFRPMSSPGIAMHASPWMIGRHLNQHPEMWQNVLEYAGIAYTQADLDRFYRMPYPEFESWIAKLTTEKIEKIQAYGFNSTSGVGNIYFAQGSDEKSAYDPEIGRVVTPKEKDAINRIKFYVIQTYFLKPG